MAFWSEIVKLQQFLPQFQALYAQRFPIEVRHYLAEWIEQQPWSSIHINPANESLARNLLETMVSELQKVSSRMSYPVTRKLNEYAVALKKTFDQQPLELVNIMNCLLMRENQLFQELRQTHAGVPTVTLPTQPVLNTNSERIKQEDANVLQQLSLLNGLIKTIQMYRSAIQQMNEAPDQEQQQQLPQCYQSQHHLQQANSPLPEYTKREEHVNQQKTTWDDHRRKRNYSILEAVRSLEQVQGLVLNMIQDWKRRLQLSGNGAYFEDNLGSLQEW